MAAPGRTDMSLSSPSLVAPSTGRRLLRTQTDGESIFDSEAVPSSLIKIAPILRVTNEVEDTNPCVAYLCRFYASEKPHCLDPTSSDHGVHQFKTALLQRLERENDHTLKERVHESDAREMLIFYRDYYKEYLTALRNATYKAERALLTEKYQRVAVLFEVMKAIRVLQSVQAGQVENDPMLKERVQQSSDAQEMHCFYHEYYKTYIQALQNSTGKADDRALLIKAYQIAVVLFDALKPVTSRSPSRSIKWFKWHLKL